MKSFLSSVVIVLATLPATAGITYDFRTVATGMQASEQAGQITVDGGNMRLEFKSGDGMMFRDGSVAISHNGGSTIEVLDPQAKTYWQLDLSSLNAAALAAMVKMSNEKVNVRDAGDGGTIEGYATQHKVVTSSADMNISAQPMHLEVTMESGVRTVYPLSAFQPFIDGLLGGTGYPAAPENAAEFEGFLQALKDGKAQLGIFERVGAPATGGRFGSSRVTARR